MKMDYLEQIEDYLDKEKTLLDQIDRLSIHRLMEAVTDAYEREAMIYIFGNGGSAATASHYANDFNKGISEFREKKFHFCCLNDNIPTVMAIANDLGYENVFEFQLRGKVKPGDLVIGISGSGNSPNVLKAIDLANNAGAVTAGLCGYDGGQLAHKAQIVLHVPSHNMQLVEDIHMIMDHLMMAVYCQIWSL